MRSEFIAVWAETRREIWEELAEEETAPVDLFCELYRALVPALRIQPSMEVIAEITADTIRSRESFLGVEAAVFTGESSLVEFLEAAHAVLDDLGGDALANTYFSLLKAFTEKYSLRYDLRQPCLLCPTLPGYFATLIRELRALTSADAHLDSLMKGFEQAVRDLRYGCSDDRIKTCISKQFMLLEGLGAAGPNGCKGTLGEMCDAVGTWPHATIRESLKKLYGFASDYPGIRHAGNAKGALRTIELRDLVAMSVLLAGFTPYMTDLVDAARVYRGS